MNTNIYGVQNTPTAENLTAALIK
jgi:hypothetical protein